jgi:hypothetical protein
MALDTLHWLRTSRPLPRHRLRELALFVDFQGCANAASDRKSLCREKYHDIRQRLESAGLGSQAESYLVRLDELENRRPLPGGDHRRFDEVKKYREAVARLDVTALAAIALEARSFDAVIRIAECDGDVDALVRILLQCQIIDDVVDHEQDLAGGLPSFLTSTASLPTAIEMTAATVQSYAASHHGEVRIALPFRTALWLFSAAAAVVVRAERLRSPIHRQAVMESLP